eukprot:scaffold40373_cov22-Cyclotella_meneghiniana.AAC.1
MDTPPNDPISTEPLMDTKPPKLRDIKNGKRFIIALVSFTAITLLSWFVPKDQWPRKFLLRELEQPQEPSLPAQLQQHDQYYNLHAISVPMQKPVMSTFFTPVKGGCCGMSEQGHLNLVQAWEDAWQSWGWETLVLTEEDARKHPRFDEMERALSQSD